MNDQPNLRLAFADQLSLKDSRLGDFRLVRHPLGNLDLPTGQIVACDPSYGSVEPFSRAVKPGVYPVVLSVAQFSKDQRVSYATLEFERSEPVRWEMAVWPGQHVNTLKAEEIFCYGVDAGTGCFMDIEAARTLKEQMDKDESVWDRLVQEMDKTYIHTWSWANWKLDSNPGLNLVAFSTGWGDGCYASYWGYSAQGDLACLVTDFSVLMTN
jgi:hypothetical protein